MLERMRWEFIYTLPPCYFLHRILRKVDERKQAALEKEAAKRPEEERKRYRAWAEARRRRERERLSDIVDRLHGISPPEYFSGRFHAGAVRHFQSRSVGYALLLLKQAIRQWAPEDAWYVEPLIDKAHSIFCARPILPQEVALTISTRWEDLVSISTNRQWQTCMAAGKPQSGYLIADLEPGRTAVAILHKPGSRKWLGRVLLRGLQDGTVAAEAYYGLPQWEPVMAALLGRRLHECGKLTPGGSGESVPFTWYVPFSDMGWVRGDAARWHYRIRYSLVAPALWTHYSLEYAQILDVEGALRRITSPETR